MTREHNNAREEWIVFSETKCIRCHTTDGVKRALEKIGKCAVVKRTTTDELARIVTGWFMEPEPEEYPDDEVATRRHQAALSRKYTFGKLVL